MLQWQCKTGTNNNNMQRHWSGNAKREQLITTKCRDTAVTMSNDNHKFQRHCSDNAKWEQLITTKCSDTAVTMQNGNKQYQPNAAALQWQCNTGTSTNNKMQRRYSDSAQREQQITTTWSDTAVTMPNDNHKFQRHCSDNAKREQTISTQCSGDAVTMQYGNK